MLNNNCIKGLHNFTPWRKIEDSRNSCNVNGTSFSVEHFEYYIRNCKDCGKLDGAPNNM